MSQFKIDNGKTGFEKAWHTSTGYECAVSNPWSSGEEPGRVVLFVRHIVGTDGLPYVESGLLGLEEHEKSDAMSDVKRCLNQAGFAEVKSLTLAAQGARAWVQQEALSFNSISVKLKTGGAENGIVAAVEAFKNLIHTEARKFIVEQETVPDVLFQSILGVMGAELDKGPGGHDHAVEVAKRLAAEFSGGTRFAAKAANN